MNVSVEIVSNQGGQNFLVDGVPPDIWNSFCERAKELRPDVENPAVAWAALLGDIIESIASVDKRVFMLRDIPKDDMDKFTTRCAQAGVDAPALLAELIGSASKDRFYLARYAKQGEDGKIIRGHNTLVLTGITEKALAPFAAIYKRYGITIPKFFAQFFAQLEQDKVEMTLWEQKDDGKVTVGTFTKPEPRNNSEERI